MKEWYGKYSINENAIENIDDVENDYVVDDDQTWCGVYYQPGKDEDLSTSTGMLMLPMGVKPFSMSSFIHSDDLKQIMENHPETIDEKKVEEMFLKNIEYEKENPEIINDVFETEEEQDRIK